MQKQSRFSLTVLLAAVFSIIMAATIGLGSLPQKPYANERLHAVIEALGAMCAVITSMFLVQGKSEQDIEKYSPLAPGFLAMGILDGIHAASRTGHAFILLHSLAGLFGGLCAALIWSPGFVAFTRNSSRTLAAVTAAVLLSAAAVVRYRDLLPAMSHDGVFASSAITMNLAAGILFLAATLYFLVDFYRFHAFESYLFSCLYLLFSLAELEFPLSTEWNANWWFWHVQRLAAYLVVLAFLLRAFHHIAAERERLILHLHHALADVKQLSGLLPICASCKKIRDDKGYWKQIEAFITEHSEAEFSHGLCPDCARKAYQELNDLKKL